MEFIEKFKSVLPSDVVFDELYELAPADLWKSDPRKAGVIALERADCFDNDAYLLKYQDVKESRNDAIQHYVMYGIDEGRNINIKYKTIHKNKQQSRSRKIKISVIIAVFNCEKFICQCIDSLINQTFNDFEIICVDDGSTDSTYKILLNYEKKYEYIHVYKQSNQFAGAARNNGMSHANGKYLLFLDSDDFFKSNMLEVIYKKAIKNDAEIVIFKGQEYDMRCNKFIPCKFPLSLSLFPKKECFSYRDFGEKLFQANSCIAWNKLIKFDYIKNINIKFGTTKSSNDTIFIYTLLSQAERISLVDEVFVNYRINNPNSLQRSKNKSWESICIAFYGLRKELIKRNLYSEQKRSFINKALQACLYYINTVDKETQALMKCSLSNKYFNLLDLNSIENKYIYNKNFYQQYMDIKKCKFIPIVYVSDDNYAKYTAVSMISIMENNTSNSIILFFIIVDKNFSDSIKYKLKNIAQRYGHYVYFYNTVRNFESAHNPIEHLNNITYYRLDIPLVLSFLDKLLFIDGDTIVNGDITELFDIDLKDNYIAGVKAFAFNNKKHAERLGIDTKNYINAGVMLIDNKKLIQDNLANKFFSLLNNKFSCLDQDIINVACSKKIINLPFKYNVMTKYINDLDRLIDSKAISIKEVLDALTCPQIIHYADKIKPWNDKNAYFSCYYNIYYSLLQENFANYF